MNKEKSFLRSGDYINEAAEKTIYSPISNLFNGGAKINYTYWFLDYMLFIILPLMWVEDLEAGAN